MSYTYYTLNPILLLIAIVPGVYLLHFVYKHDRIEPEPKPLLIKCFIFGILSTSAAVITEMIGSGILNYVIAPDSTSEPNTKLILYNFLLYFFVVALSEEGFKYLFLKLATWKDPAFDYQFDGIVYAVFVALGFAIKENIMYVSQYGLATGIVRAFTAVPGHASFGVMMGAWYGMAKKYFMLGDQEKYSKYKKYALWIPVVLHGLYDFFASMQLNIMFFAIVIAMFVICYKIVKTVSANDNYLNNVRIPNADPDFQYRTIPNEPNAQNVQSRPVNPNVNNGPAAQSRPVEPNVQYRPAEPSAQPRPVDPNVPNRPVEPTVQNRTVDTNSYNRTIDTNDFNRPNGPTQ